MKAANNDRLAYQFYDQKRMGLTNRSFIMKLELQKAVEKGEFEIYYQPLVSLETNELTGLEALIRWNHPTDGLVSDRKSTRLNSSHVAISYAVFCLKKKKTA